MIQIETAMSAHERPAENGQILEEFHEKQVRHFELVDSRCRGLQLPEGVLLRYTLSKAPIYFYLRSGVKDGKITTRLYASDSPYDRQKAQIGEVITPMFEAQADQNHMVKLQQRLRSWVEFVCEGGDADADFMSFQVHDQPE
jgi:hypothetical protein